MSARFIKKAALVEAVQFQPGMDHPWVERQMLFPPAPTEAEHIAAPGGIAPPPSLQEYECVKGHAQWLRPKPGDWIVRENGVFSLVAADEFADRYGAE